MSTEEVKAAETLGLIQGLADVVKIQQSTFQTQQATYLEALQKTNQQLSSLSETVELLSKSVPKSTLSAGSGLRLPNVTLPEFTGKQNLDRFMAQMESLLLSSGVPLRFWLTYLKQQCQKDSRAFDALIAAEKEHSSILGSDPSKATDEEYESYYKACVTVLKAKRGIPQDQQIRELLSQYYLARQSLCEIINSTLGMLIHRWIGGTLFRTCITRKSKQRESGASESPCFSQMHSEMRLSMFLQKEMT